MSTYLVHYSLTPNAKAIFPDFHFSFSHNDRSIPILPPLQIAVAQVRFSIPKRQLHGWNILYQTTVSRFSEFNTFCQQLSITNKHFNKKKNVIPEARKTPESLCGNDIPYFNLSLAAHSHARHLKYPKISSLHLLFLLHQLRHLHSTSDSAFRP